MCLYSSYQYNGYQNRATRRNTGTSKRLQIKGTIKATTSATSRGDGVPTRTKSTKRYRPGPYISRLPCCPMGVRNDATAVIATVTT